MMNNVYLLLGSNLGDSEFYIYQAKQCIESEVGMILQASSLYQTAAWGKINQPDFINQVVLVSSSWDPQQVLSKVLTIESQLDRKRTDKWGARTIDIDILFYNDDCVNDVNLVIPHPYLHQRSFTLIPLLEIAPNYMHPILAKTIGELYQEVSDDLVVQKLLEAGCHC
ncbi:MAG: 2-amino-4-hydroxy-6-hydroxymethyldihydropteridine diphosphokinase [Sphingobacteriaceae bacterium]|jgi:2-amino-4-hydroxy-6-hydroxymethyldihydropteridine diphosphokinase|nr:MAG: 2-amino-4-hydroxy-6-hydroxymethyldihydropteridine diphosphokinase [Pedobacter sp.]